jgi:hypothetical protein
MIEVLKNAIGRWWRLFSLIPLTIGQLPMIAFIFLQIMILFLLLIWCYSYVRHAYLGCTLALFNEFRLLIIKMSTKEMLS